MLVLHGVIAFDAFLVLVAGLAFLDRDLDAADAAVAFIEHGQIVVHAVGDRDAGIGERPGPHIGQIKRALIEAQLGGQVQTREQAEAFVSNRSADL